MRFSPFTHKSLFDAINQRKLRSLFKMANFEKGSFECKFWMRPT